jgi:hypothetical protein
LLERLSEMRQHLEESLERLEKSSEPLEGAAPTLPAPRNDGFGVGAPLEESLERLVSSKSALSGSRERLFESKSRPEPSFDVRSFVFATLEDSFRCRSDARAHGFRRESPRG